MRTIFIITVLLLAGCGVEQEGSRGGSTQSGRSAACVDDSGESRASGESWSDGCNTCSCGADGRVACTLKYCY